MTPIIPIVLAVSVIAAGGVVYAKRNKIKGRIKWLVALLALLSLAFVIKMVWALFDVASALFRTEFELALLSVLGFLMIIVVAFYAGRYYQHRKHETAGETKIVSVLTTSASKLTDVLHKQPILNKLKK